MIRIIHIITGLDTGGAEMMLLKLLGAMDRRKFLPEVISLTTDGIIGDHIRSLGIKVYSLGMRKGFFDVSGLFRLVRWLRQGLQCETSGSAVIIQTWMYHADLIGGLAAKMAGQSLQIRKGQGIPVVWSIHNYSLSPDMIRMRTLWVVRICAHLSRWIPSKIICSSEAARRAHISVGYAGEKTVVIPNGFDLDRFYPLANARESVLSELGITTPVKLIGMVARFDPAKDHLNLIQAAKVVYSVNSQVHFILCGEGVTWDNESLKFPIQESGMGPVFHLLGRREDIPRLLSALDIFTLSSSSESFPSVVGEAMACGVPCVVTDVGDVRLLVGDMGVIIPPRQPEKLATAWLQVLEMTREDKNRMGVSARRRIDELFSLPMIARRYETLYEDIVSMRTSCVA